MKCNAYGLKAGEIWLLGAADLVSELSSSIEDALLCVDSYRRQLESMAETISSGRRCEAVARDTGITFASGSDETLSRPEALDFAVSLKQPEQNASEEGQEVKQAKRGGGGVRWALEGFFHIFSSCFIDSRSL